VSGKYRTLIGELRYEPFPGILLLSAAGLAIIASSLWVFFMNDNWLFIIFGLLIAAGLFYKPFLVLLGIFHLWKNPEKYKEREMKEKKRLGDRR